LSEPDKRGRALLCLSLGNMVGVALAFALAGGLFGGFEKAAPIFPGMTPWREVHLAFGALSLFLLAPLFLLREPIRHEVEVAGASFATALKEIWERRGFLAPLFFGQVTVVMVDTAAGIWAAPVLQRGYHMSPEQSGGAIGLIVLVGGVAGAVIGGFAADFGQKLKLNAGVLVGAVIAAALSVPAAFFPMMPDTTTFSIAFALFVTGGAVCGLTTATAIAVMVPNEIRGLCLSLFIVVGAVIGFGLAPTMVTLVSQWLGGEQFVGVALAWTGVVTSTVGAIGFALALKNGGKRVLA
jgi:MFS family permease